MSNEDKYKQYVTKKIMKYVIVVLSLLTITLEAFALFQVISFLWGLGVFALLYVIKYFYLGTEKKDNHKSKK